MKPSPRFEAEEIRAFLSSNQLAGQAGCRISETSRITALAENKNIFQVSGPDGIFILRFPENEAQLDVLRKEERIRIGVRDRVRVLIPDTQILESEGVFPSFAIHRMIPGQPLTDTRLKGMSEAGRSQLVQDLTELFLSLHSIPLETACRWLGLEPTLGEDRLELANRFGKPMWFSPSAVLDLRGKLGERLNGSQQQIFEETVTVFQEIKVEPGYMVFGHGDLHGYNMAMLDVGRGCRLNGVFDLGCSGILDIHEDFFRISLVSEGLLDEILGSYQRITEMNKFLDRQRIGLYYRAFLFYLMAEQHGEGLRHLKTMLENHLEYQPSYPAD